MSTPNNSLSRIHTILSQSRRFIHSDRGGHASIRETWTKTFEIEKIATPSQIHKDKLLYDLLALLLDEITLAESQVASKTPLQSNAYEPMFSSIKRAFHLSTLDTNWQQYASNITDASLQSLIIFSQLLGEEEKAITSDDIEELEAILTSLEVEIADITDLQIKEYILNQIRNIRQTITSSQISGRKAFQNSLAESIGHIQVDLTKSQQTFLAQNCPTLPKLWHWLASAVNNIEIVTKILLAGEAGAKILGELLQ